MHLSYLTYLASAAGSDWNIGRSIQLKHGKNTSELSLGKSLRRLNHPTKVQPTIGVPSLLITWPPKGGREGKNLHSLTASKQLREKSELQPLTQHFIPRQCLKPEPIARLVPCLC